MSYEPEGECELAGHRELGVSRHCCDDAAVAEVIVNETKYLACAVCLALLAQLTTASVITEQEEWEGQRNWEQETKDEDRINDERRSRYAKITSRIISAALKGPRG